MTLRQVWIETLDHGLVRADQVVEVLAHRTASFAGKPARWLLDAVLPVAQGAGGPTHWNVGASHRTLIQTDREPTGAPERLVRLLGRLDGEDAAGIVTTHTRRPPDRAADGGPDPRGTEQVDFTFHAFAAASAGDTSPP